MKFTQTLCRQGMPFAWRRIWAGKGAQYADNPPLIPQSLIKKGIKLIDPTEKTPRDKWHPPVDDPRFFQHPKLEDLANYHEEPAYVCTPACRIFEGTKQAACLAKAQIFEGFPPLVEQLIGAVQIPDQDMLLQRYIMQSQYWNTTSEKLPKRIDSRKPGYVFRRHYGIPFKMQGEILARNLLRLCQSQVSNFPSLRDRRHIYKPYINSHYYYRDKTVVVRGLNDWLISSNQPLPHFANEEVIDMSVNHSLPDLFPISPTIDLQVEHNYELEHNTGMKKGWNHDHLHTLVIVDANRWKSDQRMARNLLHCLGYAIAQAHRLYGDVKILPKPICIQSVSLDHEMFSFVFFQLNTLSFDSDNGIKNFVWLDGENYLFRKILSQPWMPKAIRFERLENFDPKVFDKFMAMYLNGVPEVGKVVNSVGV